MQIMMSMIKALAIDNGMIQAVGVLTCTHYWVGGTSLTKLEHDSISYKNASLIKRDKKQNKTKQKKKTATLYDFNGKSLLSREW